MPLNYKNEKRETKYRIVGWGKYSGKKMKNVPTEYLQWFIKNAYGQMINRKRWAEEELNRRVNNN